MSAFSIIHNILIINIDIINPQTNIHQPAGRKGHLQSCSDYRVPLFNPVRPDIEISRASAPLKLNINRYVNGQKPDNASIERNKVDVINAAGHIPLI